MLLKRIFYFQFLITLNLFLTLICAQVYAQVQVVVPPEHLNPSVTDNDIIDKAKHALTASHTLKDFSIDVNSIDGNVTLNGVVNTQAQEDEAIKIVKAIFGVRNVKSNIVVKPVSAVIITPNPNPGPNPRPNPNPAIIGR